MFFHTIGNFERAFDLMWWSVFILLLNTGSANHPDIAATYLNMGHMYSEIDNQTHAHECYERSLNSYLAMFGDQNLQVAFMYQYLANV